MKKISLVSMFLLCLCVSVFAVDFSGKVEGVLESVKELQNPALFDAVLTAKAKVNENVTVQIGHNFANDVANQQSGQENNSRPETFASIKLGGGDLRVGAMKLPGVKETNTIFNNDVLADKLSNPMESISYSGKADKVNYAVTIVGGEVDDKGKPTNDLVLKVGATPMKELSVNLAYYLDVKTKNALGDSKQSVLGLDASYEVSGTVIDAQFLSFDKTMGIPKAGDTSDITNEIVIGAGYKVNDDLKAGLSYDMYGKASNIAINASYQLVKGATLRLRADLPGSDYKDANLNLAGDDTKTTIGVYLGAEF